MSKLNRYGLRFRPASIGAVPAGPFKLEAALPEEKDVARHGVIVYDRELVEAELVAFELVLLASPELISALVNEVVECMHPYVRQYLSRYEKQQDMVRGVMLNFLKKIRPYHVHVGNQDAFCDLVNEAMKKFIGVEAVEVEELVD